MLGATYRHVTFTIDGLTATTWTVVGGLSGAFLKVRSRKRSLCGPSPVPKRLLDKRKRNGSFHYTCSVVSHYPDPVISIGHKTNDESFVLRAAAQIINSGILLVLSPPVLDTEANQLAAHLFARQVHRQPGDIQRSGVVSASSHLKVKRKRYFVVQTEKNTDIYLIWSNLRNVFCRVNNSFR